MSGGTKAQDAQLRPSVRAVTVTRQTHAGCHPGQSCWGSSWLSQVVPGDRRTWGELKAKTAGPRGWERPVGLGLHLAAAETLPTHQPSPRLSQAACTTVLRADPAATAARQHRTPGCGCALPGEHQHQLAPTLAEQKWQL